MAPAIDAAGGTHGADENSWEELARKHWLGKVSTKAKPELIKTAIWDPLEQEDFTLRSLATLESLQILERFLWPTFSTESSNHHVLLIAVFFNVKQRANLQDWTLFADRPQDFSSLFRRVLSLNLDSSLRIFSRLSVLNFVIGAFQSLENEHVRKECAPLVSISTWHHLHDESARERLLEASAGRQKAWRAGQRRFEAADQETQARLRFDRAWLYSMLIDFFARLNAPKLETSQDMIYSERFVEFLIDLIRLFRDLVNLFDHFQSFVVDDMGNGESGHDGVRKSHYEALARLQRVSFQKFEKKLKVLALSNYGSIDKRSELESHFSTLSDAEMQELGEHLGFRTSYPASAGITASRAVVLETLLSSFSRPRDFQEVVTKLSVLPTSESLYDTKLLRNEHYDGSRPLGIPKLNVQYLTLSDFMWRSFQLYQAEAFYGIRKDMESLVKRMKPKAGRDRSSTAFEGFSRMALPISSPAIIEVGAPKVGEITPSFVRAEVILDVSRLTDNIRREWDNLKPHDVVFLLAVQAPDNSRLLTNGHTAESEGEQRVFTELRAAEVFQILDDNARPLRDQQMNGNTARPRRRRLLLDLDAAAYLADKGKVVRGGKDVYASLNVIARRQARENNFKPVLETIQKLVSSQTSLPSWLQEVYLGYGDPRSASYHSLPNRIESVDYLDTFLDWNHLTESFPGKVVEAVSEQSAPLNPPFVLKSSTQDVEALPTNPKKRRRDQMERDSSTIVASTYTPRNTGPYPMDLPKKNAIRFTPKQVEAIVSGTQPGLTVIVGPPGTGKTDVATQTINLLYHNFPAERILLVAHSNQALNQLFQKIIALDIDPRHLLRLGHGEEELETEASYSKYGRVESFLENRQTFLSEVNRLAASIGAEGAHAAQITEIESFIPCAMQDPDAKSGELPLKRIMLVGDHLQNSPIIQNLALRQYANFEQSLFLRFVRLGVPTIHLDQQGRCRPSIAELFKWRYNDLGNLPHLLTEPDFARANAGFRYDYQFIDVPDYQGQGEREPTPHFIQNLGEAEYAVALYQYMRLLGYPARSISILATYAGQRALIRDVLEHRCKSNKFFGSPRVVTTVDKYQGEQNDYVIVSMTRTRSVGYLRDIRRLTVALSRARLGLYILGRRDLFESCFEIKPAMHLLLQRPDKLVLTTGEMFPTERLLEDDVPGTEMDGVEHLGQYVYEMTQAKVKAMGGQVIVETAARDEDTYADGDVEEEVNEEDPLHEAVV
ncbi:hypothetical protein LTR40_005813 [Exophiala xenobiotica]|nr:hypothetical protein LTR40_005813 [Exophiala xenobiotica]